MMQEVYVQKLVRLELSMHHHKILVKNVIRIVKLAPKSMMKQHALNV